MPWTSFDTAIGRCSLEWSEGRITAVELPGGRRAADRDEADPPAPVAAVVAAIKELLAGAAIDLRDVPVDLRRASEFDRSVYAVARELGPGETITYGAIATAVGLPGAAREVGEALGRNPVPIVVPCHRVVAAGGAAGGFSAPGGVKTKLRMLAIEAPHAPGTLFAQPAG